MFRVRRKALDSFMDGVAVLRRDRCFLHFHEGGDPLLRPSSFFRRINALERRKGEFRPADKYPSLLRTTPGAASSAHAVKGKLKSWKRN
jgi:hypothetical protein